MAKKSIFTRVLATVGAVLVWLPVLAPFFFAVRVSVSARVSLFSHFDYFMPAELFPVVLVGSLLLLWAALRARSRRWLIGGGIGSAVIFVVTSQAVAVVTGLATGEIEPTGWQWALVLSFIALYIVALIVVGIGGVLLLRDLFKTD